MPRTDGGGQYYPLGIVGWNVDNSTDGGVYCSFIQFYELYIKRFDTSTGNAEVHIALHNEALKEAKITLHWYILWTDLRSYEGLFHEKDVEVAAQLA